MQEEVTCPVATPPPVREATLLQNSWETAPVCLLSSPSPYVPVPCLSPPPRAASTPLCSRDYAFIDVFSRKPCWIKPNKFARTWNFRGGHFIGAPLGDDLKSAWLPA
ncbi:hypothetical protein E2C01_016532 [Portunus trituberculatus]|uniref:Uncharacterized protein n=1 Tax=Portunus trituberculatus TaxID=210409 RepID=A0A5B7DPC9_PORTR|nr:hypothetical protein [Portunus trituberculatus]